jgi:flagellin
MNHYDIKGADASSTMATVTVLSLDTYAALAQATDISSGTGLPDVAISVIDFQLDAIAGARADLGAAMNTLAYVADSQMVEIANTEASRSRIADTDYAAATTELARAQIIQQAGTAMLAQANQVPQSVLGLLQQ